jgi:hypothetical protein
LIAAILFLEIWNDFPDLNQFLAYVHPLPPFLFSAHHTRNLPCDRCLMSVLIVTVAPHRLHL